MLKYRKPTIRGGHSMKLYKNDNDHYITPTTKYNVIPRNIFQCWHTLDLPPKMRENVDLLKRQNPDFVHYLYDDKMCAEFIHTHLGEEILYSFNKLKPGAYKADLWRYCVLYILGGIYLDIKYKCVNGFKLNELTDQEYFVKDRLYHLNDEPKKMGIYQALICSLPKNEVLFNCIQKIVYNVKHNLYNNNDLDVTGPHIFNSSVLDNAVLTFTGDSIYRNKNILQIYNKYREEQNSFSKNEYYREMWKHKNIYEYPILWANKNIEFTRTITKRIFDKDVILYSSSPTIVEYNNQYILNIRWINYNYHEDGSKVSIPSQFISLNSRFFLDESFCPISEEEFLKEPSDEEYKLYIGLGLEDIRIFKYNDHYYYNASYFDVKRNITSTSSNLYPVQDKFELERTIINPSFYDTNAKKIIEKNWSFVIYKEKLRMIYHWFPLQIGEIVGQQLNMIEQKSMPDYFKDARGSTPSYRKGNEIWFVLHKAQHYIENNKYYFNYQHFFAVFDLEMNLIRFSELFKLGGYKVEFCIGLILKDQSLILSYSLLDTKCIVSVYDIDTVNNMKWYFV
jgi:mannosyltransferase OCH1-like enzyme